MNITQLMLSVLALLFCLGMLWVALGVIKWVYRLAKAILRKLNSLIY